MKGCVQIISREIIKPSSQNHPKKLKFSYVDQLLPPIYVPLLLFYQAHESKVITTPYHHQISQQLKHSLSNCLPSFYPLAGRINDNNSVVCNDAGVEFVEARVTIPLNNVVQVPNMEDLKQYLPLDPAFVVGHGQSRPLLLVQVTFFDCGGVVVGACFSHKVFDLASAVAFLNAWSATCRGEEVEACRFTFGTSKYFPPSFVLSHSGLSKFFLTKEKLMTKRFVFDKQKLSLLKQAATESSSSPTTTTINDPTRVELVSAFIWKSFVEVAKSKGLKKTFYAFHAVNLRNKMKPRQHHENVLGNCVSASFAGVPSDQYNSVKDLQYLVAKLRSSIRRVSDDYITKPFNKESMMKDVFKVGLLLIKRKLEWCFFTSWCGFPVYEINYGWGKPIWFSTTAMPAKNVIVLVNSRGGDVVEAIVTARDDVLAMLEDQTRFLSANGKD